jgi:hypothetical protein
MNHRSKSSAAFAGAAAALALALSACGGDPSQPDAFEPNDTETFPAELGSFDDADTDVTFDMTLHTSKDEDFFSMAILDRGSDGNPAVFITADGDGTAPLELSIDFECSDGSGSHKDVQSGASPSVSFTTSCPGGGFLDDDDSGTHTAHVRRADGGASEPMAYDLRIQVD